MKIHILMPEGSVRDQFLPEPCFRALEEMGELRWNPSPVQYAEDVLRAIVMDSDAVVTGWGCPLIGGDTLPEGARLSLIAHTGGSVAGFTDRITFERGVKVCAANELFARSVAEGTIAYMLASLRRIPFWADEVQRGRWQSFADVETRGLQDRTIGLVGFGAVARHLTRMLRVFDVKIKVHADHLTPAECASYGVEKATLPEIAACDIISLHNALTPETQGMIGDAFFALVRDGALFVNTARGAIVDQRALGEALQEDRFSAVLDVYEVEPLPGCSPLRGLPNVILMPHIAGPAADRRGKCGWAMVEEIRRYFAGETLLYEIDRDAALRMTREKR